MCVGWLKTIDLLKCLVMLEREREREPVHYFSAQRYIDDVSRTLTARESKRR